MIVVGNAVVDPRTVATRMLMVVTPQTVNVQHLLILLCNASLASPAMLASQWLTNQTKYAEMLLVKYALTEHTLDNSLLLAFTCCLRHVAGVFYKRQSVEIGASREKYGEKKVGDGHCAPGA